MTDEWSSDREDVTALPITVDAARQILAYSRESCDRLLAIFGQEDQIIEWAQHEGYQIIAFARDNHVNGRVPVDERAGLTAMLKTLEAPGVIGVAVRHLDRIARREPVMLDAVERIWNLDRDIYCCHYGWIQRTVAGWKLCSAVARAAEDEADMLVTRLQNARRQKAARGGYVGGERFRRRYGVELVRLQGRLEYRPIPHEQAIIARIRADHARGLGWKTIARALNEEGVPTATRKGPWSGVAVRFIAERNERSSTKPVLAGGIGLGSPATALLSPPERLKAVGG